MPPSDPDKTIHDDLGLTAAMDFHAPQDESLRVEGLRGEGGYVGGDDIASLEFPERVWTWRRIAIATAITAIAAGELAWALSSRDSLAAKREEAARLSESEKADLEDKRQRFEKLDPAEQTRLRELQAELARDPSPESLHATLADYLKWKAQLAPKESAMLAGLSPTERAARVTTVVAEQQAIANRRFSDADSEKLIAWLVSEVRTHQDRILATMPVSVRERFENMGDRERMYGLIFHLLSPRGGPAKFEEFVADLPKLRAQLSPAAQARWDVAAKNKDEFKLLLTDWLRQSVERTIALHDHGKQYLAVNDQELQRYFEHVVSEQQRQRLLALPKEEMMAQLRREYLRSKGEWKDPSGKSGPFGRQPLGGVDDGRGGFRRPPDAGYPGKPGPMGQGERRQQNGEKPLPPPPPPRVGESRPDEFRGGDRSPQGTRDERDRKFNPERKPSGENRPDGAKKPDGENGPVPERRRDI